MNNRHPHTQVHAADQQRCAARRGSATSAPAPSGAPGNSIGTRTGTCQATDGRQRVVMPPLASSPHLHGPGRAGARAPGEVPRARGQQPPSPNRSPALPGKASQPTPTAASPSATCSTSFKQSRHAATAQGPTRPPRQAEHGRRSRPAQATGSPAGRHRAAGTRPALYQLV
jgi:hypothetical protein